MTGIIALENAIERAVVLGSTELIQPEDLPDSILEETSSAGEQVTVLPDGIQPFVLAYRTSKLTPKRQRWA